MLNQSQTPTVRPIDLSAPPFAVAKGLAHLPGLVFLDSSSTEVIGGSEEQNFSIVTARPSTIYEGNIHSVSSRAILESVIDANRTSNIDRGFPTGGLVGWVEYEGHFRFGEYRDMLVYDYSNSQWFEVGNLSPEIDFSKDPKARPSFELAFQNEMDRETFCEIVERAQEYIASGDIYQVNLSHRFTTPWETNPEELMAFYGALRHVSPAPYSSFMQLGERAVLSTSPEQFLKISGQTIETRPIKGTRPRFPDRERDEKSAYDLITSTKEISELIMITDLERNDLGQICEYGSVETTELLKLERFAQVFHLVSTVQGKLRRDVNHVEALASCFPGGSITGAPKKRSREIISELESIDRGLYTGSIGCFGFNGESHFNIAIRTAIHENDQLYFQVGAGIVADSTPNMEWEETLHKAAGIIRTGHV